jgi:hypothetical protein
VSGTRPPAARPEPSTLVRIIWTLEDGSEVGGPMFSLPVPMRDLGRAKFNIELWADHGTAVSIDEETER